ncbi:MAG: hypothetical protein ACKOW9_06115 [Candidatus Paceibacterota bacterium]
MRVKKAYTLAEATTTFFIIGAISLIIFATLKPDTKDQGGDLSAKISLSALIDQQNTALMKGESLKSPSELSEFSAVVFSENPSNNSTEVSVSVDGSLMHASARADESSCWVVKKDFSVTALEQEVWAIKKSVTCSYQEAYGLTPGSNGEGLSKDNPIIE